MKYYGPRDIFATRIWGFEVESRKLEYYTTLLYHMRNNNMGKNGGEAFYYSNGSWQSPNLIQFEEFTELFDELENQVNEFIQKDNDDRGKKKLKLFEAWGNINPPKTNINEHLHIGADYSGVVYLQAFPECGNINFRDPRIHYEMVYQTADVSVVPAVGRSVVFPGWLRHSVDPNNSDKDRVGIAFNFKVE